MSELTFRVSDSMLRRWCAIAQLPLEHFQGNMVFFGIRGALPPQADGTSFDYSPWTAFRENHELKAVQINYFYPRCMLGQWLPDERRVALFPGSTVPNLGYVHRGAKRNHEFNQLVEGCYPYRKGQHPYSDTGFQPHQAFRMQGRAIVRRANYELREGQPAISYAPADSVISVSTPADNIHAARNNPRRTVLSDLRGGRYSFSFTMADFYSSYGCQVVVGNPAEHLPAGETNGEWNAWDRFQQNAYTQFHPEQTDYSYILIHALWAHGLAQHSNGTRTPAVLCFGSQGELVERVQQRLNTLRRASTGQPYYPQGVDGDFGPNTAEAVIQYQNDVFNGAATGIVGPQMAESLGIGDWPEV